MIQEPNPAPPAAASRGHDRGGFTRRLVVAALGAGLALSASPALAGPTEWESSAQRSSNWALMPEGPREGSSLLPMAAPEPAAPQLALSSGADLLAWRPDQAEATPSLTLASVPADADPFDGPALVPLPPPAWAALAVLGGLAIARLKQRRRSRVFI